MSPTLHTLRFPGAILERGFWLYVWDITTASGGAVLYVGRTGDEASVNAQSPFTRVSQHLGSNKNANAMRRNLEARKIDPAGCTSYEMVAYGPVFAETRTWEEHVPSRDKVAAAEKALCDALTEAGYDVVNKIHCKRKLDDALWQEVLAAFAEHFPKLSRARSASIGEL